MANEDEGVAGATGSSRDFAGMSAKPTVTSDENWEEMDLKAASTIKLCLAAEVMYNVIDEETVTGL